MPVFVVQIRNVSLQKTLQNFKILLQWSQR